MSEEEERLSSFKLPGSTCLRPVMLCTLFICMVMKQTHVDSISIENYPSYLPMRICAGALYHFRHYSHTYKAEAPLLVPTHAPASMSDSFQTETE